MILVMPSKVATFLTSLDKFQLIQNKGVLVRALYEHWSRRNRDLPSTKLIEQFITVQVRAHFPQHRGVKIMLCALSITHFWITQDFLTRIGTHLHGSDPPSTNCCHGVSSLPLTCSMQQLDLRTNHSLTPHPLLRLLLQRIPSEALH